MSRLSTILAAGSASLVLLGGTAQADNGQILFSGEVRASTCEVNGGEASTEVTLADTSTTRLGRPGHTDGETRFVLQVRNCPDTFRRISAYFEGDMINADGRLDIDPGRAGNVQLQLLNEFSLPMNLAASRGNQNATERELVGNAIALPFFVRYYATGPVTAGLVSSRVQYSLDYL